MKYLLSSAALVAATSCTTPNPGYCPSHNCNDAGTTMDAPDPKATIRVAVTGNDAADGITAPVKTLKRAIELANANGAITTIRLDAGRYSTANGETYPYTVPAGVTVAGTSGTVLAGTHAEDGLVAETATLSNLELNDFKTAVHAKVAVTMVGVTVKTSELGVLADGAAKITATHLTFVGRTCADIGLKALGTSQSSIDMFVVTGGTALQHDEQASASLANGSITDAPACTQISAAGRSLTLSNTQIMGGGSIHFGSAHLEVTLENTTIADAPGDAISGWAHVFHMTGGELRNNGRGAAEFVGGSYTFTNVGIKGNPVFGIYLQSGTDPGILVMRGCTISGNASDGIYLFAGATGDFGTSAAPGNNTFRGNGRVGLDVDTSSSAVTAVGNTWNANTQGANANGIYSSQLVTSQILPTAGNNFAIVAGSTLQL